VLKSRINFDAAPDPAPIKQNDAVLSHFPWLEYCKKKKIIHFDAAPVPAKEIIWIRPRLQLRNNVTYYALLTKVKAVLEKGCKRC
jgi:hypothetical protein